MPSTNIQVATHDGSFTTEIVTPGGGGPWPSVVLCFDAAGLRPTMTSMAERIASWGYLVAIPNLYHRAGSTRELVPPGSGDGPIDLGTLFSDKELASRWRTRFMPAALDYTNLETDIGALLDALAKRPDVGPGVATTGYCMGGNASFRLATIFGDRIAATASFHGGGLVSDRPDSPHLRAGAIRAKVYVAGAIEDGSFTDEAKQKLVAALDAAKVDSEVETYPAHHGFAVPDNDAYDPAAAERHYQALEKLLSAVPR